MTTAFATPHCFTDYLYWDFEDEEIAEVTKQLEIDSAIIRIAAKQSGQLDCLDDDGTEYLKALNVYMSAINHNSLCARLSQEQRQFFAEWVTGALTALQEGLIDLCGGTNKLYPAFGVAEIGVTQANEALIIANRFQRNLNG